MPYHKSIRVITWAKSRTYKVRKMFSQKSVRRFVGDSSAFVMGAILLASALNRSISPGTSDHFLIFSGGDCLCLGHWLRIWRTWRTLTNADESRTNRITLFPIYLSLFVVATLWHGLASLPLASCMRNRFDYSPIIVGEVEFVGITSLAARYS